MFEGVLELGCFFGGIILALSNLLLWQMLMRYQRVTNESFKTQNDAIRELKQQLNILAARMSTRPRT